jgi:hypothetical protein
MCTSGAGARVIISGAALLEGPKQGLCSLRELSRLSPMVKMHRASRITFGGLEL